MTGLNHAATGALLSVAVKQPALEFAAGIYTEAAWFAVASALILEIGR